MVYQVVPYAERFQQEIVDLILPIQQDEFDLPITIKDQPDLLSISSFYLKGNGNFWVAQKDDKIVGTIALIDFGDNQGALRKMFVHVDHRGKDKGVAQQLFDALLSWCTHKKTRELFLGTIDTMYAAHRFYVKNGFEELAKVELPDNFPIMRVDNKFFKLNVKPT
jgi:N-acetylglutamate synthase-like GNAT family acetyltransferase